MDMVACEQEDIALVLFLLVFLMRLDLLFWNTPTALAFRGRP